MMTLDPETPIARARRSQNEEIRMYADRAMSYLEQIKRALDEAEASQEDEGNDA